MDIEELNRFVGKIESSSADGERFVSIFVKMVDLLDEGDSEDMFGTEGWRSRLGLE